MFIRFFKFFFLSRYNISWILIYFFRKTLQYENLIKYLTPYFTHTINEVLKINYLEHRFFLLV